MNSSISSIIHIFPYTPFSAWIRVFPWANFLAMILSQSGINISPSIFHLMWIICMNSHHIMNIQFNNNSRIPLVFPHSSLICNPGPLWAARRHALELATLLRLRANHHLLATRGLVHLLQELLGLWYIYIYIYIKWYRYRYRYRYLMIFISIALYLSIFLSICLSVCMSVCVCMCVCVHIYSYMIW